MLPPLAFSTYYGENDFYPILLSSGITLFCGGLLKIFTRKSKDAEIKKKKEVEKIILKIAKEGNQETLIQKHIGNK